MAMHHIPRELARRVLVRITPPDHQDQGLIQLLLQTNPTTLPILTSLISLTSLTSLRPLRPGLRPQYPSAWPAPPRHG